MKILVLSDSHYKNIELSLEGYDYIIHCGDYGKSLDYLMENDISFVRGNCDMLGDKIISFDIDNKKYLVTHGDLFNVKFTYDRLYYKALESNSNIVLFGHTHFQEYFTENGIHFLNPGAYQDGYYAIIEDNKISLYYDNKVRKIIKIGE